MELSFGMPLSFRHDLAVGTRDERNAYASWRHRFEGKTVYLVGWCEAAFAVTDFPGQYEMEYISGNPEFLFKPALATEVAG